MLIDAAGSSASGFLPAGIVVLQLYYYYNHRTAKMVPQKFCHIMQKIENTLTEQAFYAKIYYVMKEYEKILKILFSCHIFRGEVFYI